MPNLANDSASDSAAPTSLTALIHNAAPTAESPLSAEALSDKQVASYIRSLSNFSLADLRTQPQQLHTKSEALHQQLSQLCISQTDAFIHIHQAEQQFAPSLNTFANHLEDLIAHTLPQLQAATDAFASASQPVLAERERVQNVVDQYERGHLSDLLEIPPLVLTCVKSGHHSDAIQLADHLVGLLEPSASHDNIDSADDHSSSSANKPSGQRNTYLSLLIETLSHLAVMKSDLISSFSKPGLKLPAALKSTSVLRRLTRFEKALPRLADWHTVEKHHAVPHLSMSETQLCLSFLKARIRSFRSALDAMGSSSSLSSQTFLRRYIDLWREEMADTLSMAFALFVDTDPQGTSDHGGDAMASDMVTPAYLISSFATSGFERLRDTISTQLVASVHTTQASSPGPSASVSNLETLAELFANVHTQLSYASASLTRFGFDFGTLLSAPSSNASTDPSIQSLSTIEATWLDALTKSLDHAFSLSHTLFDQNPQTSDAALPSQWLLSSQLPTSALENLYQVSTTDSTSYDDFSRPNIELVDYPPLGKLLNRLLEWINALQVFAPTALAPLLLRQFDRHFARLSQRLLSEVPAAILRVDADTIGAERLLNDEEAQRTLQHLDHEEKRELQTNLIRDRESVILTKVLEMWQHSVVDWTRNVVASQIYDIEVDAKGEADVAWAEAEEWIGETLAKIVESNKQRRQNAAIRKKKVEEDVAREKAEAEERERVEAEERARREKEEEEEARRKAEEEARLKAEEVARLKAEEEARLKAEEEARLKAEEEARLKAEEVARLKAEEEARLKAEEEARLKAEEEAKLKAEEEAKLKAEEEARLKAEEEARMKAEEARLKEEAQLKAEVEARLKAEAEAKAKAKAKAEAEAEAEARKAARLKAEEEAELKAEQEAKLKAKQEAKLKAEQEAKLKAEQEAKLKAEEEEQARLEARAKAEAEAAAEAAKAEEAARLNDEEQAKFKAQEEAKAKAETSAKAHEEAKEATRVAAEDAAESKAAEGVAPAEAESKASTVEIVDGAEPTQKPANDDADPSRTAQAKEEALKDNAQPAPSAAAPKKFSLAEKLRQRKEERDRAAAAAAASQNPKEEARATEQSIDTAPTAVAELVSASEDRTTKNVEGVGDPTADAVVSATTEDKEPSTLPSDATEAVKENPADEGEDDGDDADADGDGDDSGANTPATPATPNPEATFSSGAAKKKKKNKKKKK